MDNGESQRIFAEAFPEEYARRMKRPLTRDEAIQLDEINKAKMWVEWLKYKDESEKRGRQTNDNAKV